MYRLAPLILQNTIWFPTRIFLYTFFQFNIQGQKYLKNIDRSHGVIFAPNHASPADPILVTAALNFLSHFYPCFYVSLERSHYAHLTYLRYLTHPLFFKAWGAYPVKRGIKDYEKSLKPHIDILKDKNSLVLFIEGGISKNGTTTTAKPGIGYLTEHTGATIVPVAISGAHHISILKSLIKRQTITINFLEPLDTKKLLTEAPVESRARMYYIANTVLQKIINALAS